MFHRIAQRVVLPPAVAAVAVVLIGLALPDGAGAASKPAAPKLPTPVSETNCWGSLKPAPAAGEPNLLNYQFNCDTPITAYTIVVNRTAWEFNVIDDFDTSPVATLGDGTTPDSRTSWICEGTVPSDGFNCNAGAGGSMAAWSYAEGSFDTSDAYCGTPATPSTKKTKKHGAATKEPKLQRAFAQLIVTDSTAAQDGPFILWSTVSCKAKKSHAHHAARDK